MSENGSAGMKVMYMIWGWLLLITIVEVALTYFQLSLLVMLVVLMGLSLIKAALIISYFMHLKFERMSLVLTLIPALIVCILLMSIIFPDSLRVRDKGVFRDQVPPAADSGH